MMPIVEKAKLYAGILYNICRRRISVRFLTMVRIFLTTLNATYSLILNLESKST